RAEKRLKEIASAVKGAKHLFLATDPDREGEAISWHIEDVLRQRHALKGVDVKRVVFHEITKQAVQDAFKHPRDVNQELVDAYLARRALDYLVGFTLSPVLWRKLPGSRSAACNRSRCASSANAKTRSKRSRRANTGPSRPSSRPRKASASPRASPISTARSSTSSISTARRKRATPPTGSRGPPALPSPRSKRNRCGAIPAHPSPP